MLIDKTPSEITDLQRFGWGKFSDEQIADKTNVIREKMALRPPASNTPRVSVVVPAYQEEEYILGTLLSLASQTHEDVEFIVVSNGESLGNATQQIAESAGFNVIHEPKKGWTQAHQAGLEASRGTVYATTDADTLHFSDWLTTADEILQTSNSIAATGRVHFFDLKPGKRLYRMVADTYKQLFEYDGLKLMRGAWGTNSFYIREALQEAGGYRDLRGDIWADTAVLYRVLPNGGEVVMQDPRAHVFSSARRMNKTSVRGLVTNALRRRLNLLGIHSVFQEPDVR